MKKKTHMLAAGMTVALPVAFAGLTPGSAMAAAAHHGADGHWVARSGKVVRLDPGTVMAPATAPRWAGLLFHSVPFYVRSAGTEYINISSSVYITCYYSGAPKPDKYWDHISKIRSGFGGVEREIGHVWDWSVNLGGKYPGSVGIPHC